MKISVTDTGSGIVKKFAKAIGATVRGRFIDIPKSMGSGYMTGFSWGRELRMMIRNYHLKEDVFIQRTNELAEGQEDLVFLLTGIFPSMQQQDEQLMSEQPNILICRHSVSSVMIMPRATLFGSVTIAVSKQYLRLMFANIDHPVVQSVLEATDNFVFESEISEDIVNLAGEMLIPRVRESMESNFYKLKCEEMLFLIFETLMRREIVPSSAMHINDVTAIYAIKSLLLKHFNEPPNINALSKKAGMSEPKLRKLFKQTFGKGPFEYYQYHRIQKAASLLRKRRLTVSEVGFELGFTNLSHFTRVFEQHMGSKPKRYSNEN
jgi:AraC-like DNA-binding protein